VFAMQGFGNFTAALVALIVTVAFKKHIENDADFHSIDYMWRIIIGLGCVPAVIALYYRLTIPETPRYTMDIERDLAQAEVDADFVKTGKFESLDDQAVERVEVPRASRRDFFRHYGKWSNFKVLFGCAWSWFALDIAFYGLGLNSSIILTAIGFGSGSSTNKHIKTYDTLYNQAVGNMMCVQTHLFPASNADIFLRS
jgi:PHS family inorganic phosphate transporter-like MFS transporter